MEGAFQAKMKTNEGNTRRKKNNNNKKLEFIQHVNIAKKKTKSSSTEMLVETKCEVQ